LVVLLSARLSVLLGELKEFVGFAEADAYLLAVRLR
jgi:hypothetical protein